MDRFQRVLVLNTRLLFNGHLCDVGQVTEQDKNELYNMHDNPRPTREQNDKTLERIYIDRRFKNDTERFEKLFDLYVKMTATAPAQASKAPAKRVKRT